MYRTKAVYFYKVEALPKILARLRDFYIKLRPISIFHSKTPILNNLKQNFANIFGNASTL